MNTRQRKRALAALAYAIERGGGVSAVATALNVSKAAVSKWDVCPAARTLELEKLTGISRKDLRPDYYPEG